MATNTIRINKSSIVRNAKGTLETNDLVPNPGVVSSNDPSWKYGCFRSDNDYLYPFHNLSASVLSIGDGTSADIYTWKIGGTNYFAAVIPMAIKRSGFVGGRVDPNPPSGGKRGKKNDKSTKNKKTKKSTALIPKVKVTDDNNVGYKGQVLNLLIPIKNPSTPQQANYDHPKKDKIKKK
ncbi:MAG: hypothetical protein GY751_16125, partial [Bacteroidetes bacterium]|nr:hypothetical protein [Bacteroidota bacterium]